ncbi:probable G-protein coupled receptor Mth-like 11 isoform X1 [Drosophila nasuta]|uniref:probable G-protein coupled receptor Mth-like 11 isoform X1 n=1 Tax=Drosophila nasuta TaxID=42062 RepID=UPI00295E4731|nr:probable G-protein coupled receptor Mth-like 11 isoform X1 [Drosophila nasuta]
MFIIRSAFLFILSIILAAEAEDNQKCEYFDSVDLENSQKYENGSYLYRGILIPSEKVHQYTYRETVFQHNKTVEPYMRGCLCQIKSCVLLCCEPEKSMRNFVVNMTLDNGTETQVNVINEFEVQVKYEMSCDLLENPNYDEQAQPNWKLFQDGKLKNLSDDNVLEKNKYCLIPHKVSEENYYLVPTTINPDSENHTKINEINIIRVITVFCIAIIIAAYCYSPKLNAGSNRCYIYYFVCLANSYILLWVDLEVRVGAATKDCYVLGYSGYFTIMSTFLWLLVINFNLWNTITRYKVSVHMLRYNIFVWGTAAILTAITAYMEMQEMSDSDRDIWQPGVTINGCWIETKNWSAMIYLYGPILLSILINSTLAIVTAKHLYVHHMKTNQVWNNSESIKNLKNKSDFIHFFRIFLISGVFWIMEIFAYLFNIEWFAFIVAGQGLILPFVTICNKKVIRDLNKRLNPNRKKDYEPVTTMETLIEH